MEHTRTLNYLVKNESIVGCKLTLILKMFLIPLLIGFASLYYSIPYLHCPRKGSCGRQKRLILSKKEKLCLFASNFRTDCMISSKKES